MTKSIHRKRDAFNQACYSVRIPKLQFVGYYQAHDDVAFLITRNTLRYLGFNLKKASSMAGSRGGGARARLDALDNLI